MFAVGGISADHRWQIKVIDATKKKLQGEARQQASILKQFAMAFLHKVEFIISFNGKEW